jgi:hypothetical protein
MATRSMTSHTVEDAPRAMNVKRTWHRARHNRARSVLTPMRRTSCGWTVTRDEVPYLVRKS